MTTVQISVKGAKESAEIMKYIGRNVDTLGFDISKRMARFIQKSARQRARRWRWTGTLEQNIIVMEEKGKIQVIVADESGIYQEFGFRKHFVSAETSTRKAGTFGDWIAQKYSKNPNARGLMVSKNYNPSGYFALPAVKEANKRFPEIAKKSIDDRIMKGIERMKTR